MKTKKWIFAPALLAVALGTATISHSAFAKPAGAGKKRPAPMITPMTLEKIIGKPLTDDQKAAVADAAKVYQESIAKAVGLTSEELAAKAKEYRKAERANKGGGAAAPAAPTAPATPPA